MDQLKIIAHQLYIDEDINDEEELKQKIENRKKEKLLYIDNNLLNYILKFIDRKTKLNLCIVSKTMNKRIGDKTSQYMRNTKKIIDNNDTVEEIKDKLYELFITFDYKSYKNEDTYIYSLRYEMTKYLMEVQKTSRERNKRILYMLLIIDFLSISGFNSKTDINNPDIKILDTIKNKLNELDNELQNTEYAREIKNYKKLFE